MADIPLDIYDDYRPKAMDAYLRFNGWNFSKKAYEYAVKGMFKRNTNTGKREKVEVPSKEKIDEIFKRYNINLEHNKGYNYMYAFAMGYADYYKSSITDEQHLAMYVKDVIDDPDNEGGNVFRKFYADCVAKGEPLEWEDLLD